MEEKNIGKFEQKTRDALIACGEWLGRNAEQLAKTFAGGCKDWSVEFRAGDDGMFPCIHVEVSKVDKHVIDAYLTNGGADNQ